MKSHLLAIRGLAVIAAAVIGFTELRPGNHDAVPAIVISDDAVDQRIAVEVLGAVATPGLYWLAGDARVQTALDAAGGARTDADLSGLNLARRVEDEEQLEVASNSAPIIAAGGSTIHAAATQASTAVRININLATAAELDALPGIGPALAARIIAYRTQNGPFASVEELSNVKGISTRMVGELRDLISIGS